MQLGAELRRDDSDDHHGVGLVTICGPCHDPIVASPDVGKPDLEAVLLIEPGQDDRQPALVGRRQKLIGNAAEQVRRCTGQKLRCGAFDGPDPQSLLV